MATSTAAVTSDDEVEVLRSEIMRTIERDCTDIPQPVAVRNLQGMKVSPVTIDRRHLDVGPPFHKPISHPQITEGLAQLTGAGGIAHLAMTRSSTKLAQIGGVNMWHQDASYWPIIASMTEVTAGWRFSR